jgi:hypothetical protein
MRTIVTIALLFFSFGSQPIFAQANWKTHKAGHVFDIDIPEYMSRTIGLNSASAIEYKSTVKNVYGFVIFDTKEELAVADMKYFSITEFYEDFMKDFLKEEEVKNISKPTSLKKGDNQIMECDVTFLDKESKVEIYYLVGIVETKKSYYKVLSWAAADKKATFKADFQKILYSIKD